MNLPEIAVEGRTLLFSLLGVFLLIIGIILVARYLMSKKSGENLAEKYQDKQWSSPLKARAKYPDVDVFNLSGPFLNFGLAAALGITLLAFSWTQRDDDVYIPEDALELEEDIEIEPPRTAEPPPPPPPPPPPVIEEVPEEEIEEEEEPEFLDQSVEEETIVEAPPEPEAPPPPPPPPPPPEPEVEEIFKVVEQMPRFPGCENEGGDNNAKKACADKKMLEFIYKNIKYPAIARENGVEGQCVIRFVVEKDGSIQNPHVVRDIGAGCGDESLRVVKLMNNMGEKWTPGKQRGRSVRVQFNLPVKFKLE